MIYLEKICLKDICLKFICLKMMFVLKRSCLKLMFPTRLCLNSLLIFEYLELKHSKTKCEFLVSLEQMTFDFFRIFWMIAHRRPKLVKPVSLPKKVKSFSYGQLCTAAGHFSEHLLFCFFSEVLYLKQKSESLIFFGNLN